MDWHRRLTVFVAVLIALVIPVASMYGQRPVGEPSPSQSESDPGAESNCDQPLPGPATADGVAQVLVALQQVVVKDWSSGVVPEPACPLIMALKHRLRDFILDRLNSAGLEPVEPLGFRARILGELGYSGVMLDDSDWPGEREQHPFGRIRALEVSKPSGHPDLMAVTVRISINCGQDSVLYIFKQMAGVWRLLIGDEGTSYEVIEDARESLDYSVSPVDVRGDFFVAVATITPACSGSWRTLWYRVLRPGPEPYEPRAILDKKECIWLGSDPPYTLQARAGGFTLDFMAPRKLDQGFRRHIVKYQIAGDQAIRVAPLAEFPEDFLDEWSSQPWDEASRWVAKGTPVDLERIHSELHRDDDDDDGPYPDESPTIVFVQDCGPGDRKWQIGFKITRVQSHEASSKELFFTIVKDGNTFRVADGSETRPEGCPGNFRPSRLRPN